MKIKPELFKEIKEVKFKLEDILVEKEDALEALVEILAEAETGMKTKGGIKHLVAVRAVLEAGLVVETGTAFIFMMPPTFAACELVPFVKKEIRKKKTCKVRKEVTI